MNLMVIAMLGPLLANTGNLTPTVVITGRNELAVIGQTTISDTRIVPFSSMAQVARPAAVFINTYAPYRVGAPRAETPKPYVARQVRPRIRDPTTGAYRMHRTLQVGVWA